MIVDQFWGRKKPELRPKGPYAGFFRQEASNTTFIC